MMAMDAWKEQIEQILVERQKKEVREVYKKILIGFNRSTYASLSQHIGKMKVGRGGERKNKIWWYFKDKTGSFQCEIKYENSNSNKSVSPPPPA